MDQAHVDVLLLETPERSRDDLDVLGRRLEVRDQDDVAVLDLVPDQHAAGEVESRRDACAGAERLPPRVLWGARARRREHAQKRLELGGRGPRGQQLVRHIREDDEPDRRVDLQQPSDRALHVRVALLLDREREVENDDARRAAREKAALANVEVTSRGGSRREQRERRAG